MFHLPVFKWVLGRALAEQKAKVPALEDGHVEYVLEVIVFHDIEL